MASADAMLKVVVTRLLLINKSFDKFVMLPEEEKVGSSWVPNHKVEDGQILSLARMVANILQDKDYTHGAQKHYVKK